MSAHVHHPRELLGHVAAELGTSDWILIDQTRINGLADVTEDRQWIHVDPERAKAGPFGTTIVHGYLTLSLAPVFLAQTVEVANVTAAVNYGLNRVRFPAPVPVDSRVRGTLTLVAATERGSSIEVVFGLVVELEGGDRPACVAELVVLYS
jgi:acyl dehydratase